MSRPHLKYKAEDFGEILPLTNALFEAKPWRVDVGAEQLYRTWVEDVCSLADVSLPDFTNLDSGQVGYQYQRDYAGYSQIVLGRLSLASLFCAVGQHLYQEGEVDGIDVGIDPRVVGVCWGYSLFYVCRPIMFRRRVREGRIVGLTAKDTFSADTWAQLVSLGLTNGAFLSDPAFDIRTLAAEDDLVNPSETEEANESEELAPVIPIRDAIVNAAYDDRDLLEGYVPSSERSAHIEQMMQFSITELRKASRGRVSGGYNMNKVELVTRLLDEGIAFDEVQDINS